MHLLIGNEIISGRSFSKRSDLEQRQFEIKTQYANFAYRIKKCRISALFKNKFGHSVVTNVTKMAISDRSHNFAV